MSKKPNVLACLILITCQLIFLYSCKDQKSKNLLDEPSEVIKSQLLSIAKGYLNGQYDYLTDSSKELTWQKFQTSSFEDTIINNIDNFKNELQKIDFAYTSYSSNLKADSIVVDGTQVTLFAREVYSLTTNDKDPDDPNKFIVTEGSNTYMFVFVVSERGYLINELHSSDKNRFKVNLNYDGLQDGKLEDYNDFKMGYTYSPQEAKKYAYQHYLNGNSDYCDFTSGGGDCTNFLSQCLLQGGWTIKKDKWETKKKSECSPPCKNTNDDCNIHDCYTCNWTVAQDFKYHITKGNIKERAHNGSFADKDLDIGDVLQLAGTPSDNVYHSCIVTKKTVTNGITKVYVTCRTSSGHSPAKDKLSTLFEGYHYGWKIKSRVD